jgi:hypothetical protein
MDSQGTRRWEWTPVLLPGAPAPARPAGAWAKSRPRNTAQNSQSRCFWAGSQGAASPLGSLCSSETRACCAPRADQLPGAGLPHCSAGPDSRVLGLPLGHLGDPRETPLLRLLDMHVIGTIRRDVFTKQPAHGSHIDDELPDLLVMIG